MTTKYRFTIDLTTTEFADQTAANEYAVAMGGSADDVEAFSFTAPSLLEDQVIAAISSARAFGSSLITKFAASNMLLGITQLGMTSQVRKNTSEVVSCLITGSLYDAMAEIRTIPEEDKDNTFITDARMLAVINDIEDYLHITRSTSL